MRARHLVQLFDDVESLAGETSEFLAAGVRSGEALLIITTLGRRRAITARLAGRGIACDDLERRGAARVLDVETIAEALLRGDRVDGRRFAAVVGRAARRLAAGGTRVRAYGDVVDVFASRGDLQNAVALEHCWNELLAQMPVTLFCGYLAAGFGDPRSAAFLSAICSCHGQVRVNPQDVLGSFLVQAHAPYAASVSD